MAKFDNQKLAKRVREKRGQRTVREVAEELQIGIATISRIENGKFPDVHIFGILWQWLGENPATFFLLDGEESDDPITGQLRAAQNMSAETAAAFMEVIRAAYAQVLAQADDDDKA